MGVSRNKAEERGRQKDQRALRREIKTAVTFCKANSCRGWKAISHHKFKHLKHGQTVNRYLDSGKCPARATNHKRYLYYVQLTQFCTIKYFYDFVSKSWLLDCCIKSMIPFQDYEVSTYHYIRARPMQRQVFWEGCSLPPNKITFCEKIYLL